MLKRLNELTGMLNLFVQLNDWVPKVSIFIHLNFAVHLFMFFEVLVVINMAVLVINVKIVFVIKGITAVAAVGVVLAVVAVVAIVPAVSSELTGWPQANPYSQPDPHLNGYQYSPAKPLIPHQCTVIL